MLKLTNNIPHIAKQMKRDWELVDGLMLNQLKM
jgi:hypothetical protein